MRKKKTSTMFFVTLLSLFLLSTSVYGGILDQFQSFFTQTPQETTFRQGTQERCRDIYAYFPAWRCCDKHQPETGDITVAGTIPPNDYWKCPENAVECEVSITSLSGGIFYSAYDQNCWREDPCTLPFSCPKWKCDGETRHDREGTRVTLNGGQVFYGWHPAWGGSGQAQYKVYKKKLCDCPLNPCGLPCPKVKGSTQCTFVTNKDVYDESRQIKKEGEEVEEGISYTVPQGSCYSYYPEANRHKIGDTCEKCSDNSDCIQLYRNSYEYNGKTYGAVCSGSDLQLYGCVPSGEKTCIKWKDADMDEVKDFNEECKEYGRKKRCDLYKALDVQCCPGTSACGPQSFCDPETYTCKRETECQFDTDCGRKVQCDYTTKVLKTPVCKEGTCDWKTEEVECCNDDNCPSGWYCSANHKCFEEPDVKETCPFMCCENSTRYFDKPCPSGQTCCADNFCRDQCNPNPGVCNYNDKCEPDRGETKENCGDCEKRPPQVCEKDCMPWDIGCKLEVMWCKFVKAVKGTFMWIGVGVVIILVLFIIWKVLSARVPRLPAPPVRRRR
ncbi:hypothetical protein AKJ58_01655 [candidate division MSBL1 archaeon SCGC-AAA385D11]|uniref:Uncharacterized protein n=1 Tax=candidate division MSBL1 archaeon SCGC-AAA385D11 TaxID=1698286 RepID=A0A133VN56_9EURY|nr:hypothetical protein AKJ58_01655 [candidate division MSBL1 archaeon SCGC-AAA385D11]